MRQFEGRGADILAECLIDAGVDLIFGVPGDTGVVFYDALYQRTDQLRHILARDERHAAFMADGYARWTNRVGVCEVSSGGGADFLSADWVRHMRPPFRSSPSHPISTGAVVDPARSPKSIRRCSSRRSRIWR